MAQWGWAGGTPEVQFYRARAAAARNLPFDLNSLVEKVQDLKQQDKQLGFFISRSILAQASSDIAGSAEFLPLAPAISHSRVLLCNENGYFPLYHTDRFGFFNLDDVYARDNDLMIIGDSFGMGACVHQKENLASQLRAQGLHVANMSVSDIGPLSCLALLYEYGPVVRPRDVILLYYEGNDFPSIALEAEQSPVMRNYLDDESFRQDLVGRQEEVDELYTRVERLALLKSNALPAKPEVKPKGFWAGLSSLRGIKNFISWHIKGPLDSDCRSPGYEANVDNLRQVLPRIRDFSCCKLGAPLLFVYLPSYDSVAPRLFRDRFRPCSKSAVLRVLEENGIDLLDVTDVFSSSPHWEQLFPFGIRGHYSKEGYRMVADAIAARIRSRSLSCRPADCSDAL